MRDCQLSFRPSAAIGANSDPCQLAGKPSLASFVARQDQQDQRDNQQVAGSNYVSDQIPRAWFLLKKSLTQFSIQSQYP